MDRITKAIIDGPKFQLLIDDIESNGVRVIKYSDLQSLSTLQSYMANDEKILILASLVDAGSSTSVSIFDNKYRRSLLLDLTLNNLLSLND